MIANVTFCCSLSVATMILQLLPFCGMRLIILRSLRQINLVFLSVAVNIYLNNYSTNNHAAAASYLANG